MTVAVANDTLAIATLGLYEESAAGVAPTTPTLSAVQLTDTSIRMTVDGDAGATNYFYYMASSDSAWTSGGNRSGDGTADITGLTTGTTYYMVVYSDNLSSLSAPSNLITVTLLSTATTTTPLGEAAAYLYGHGETTDIIYKPNGGSERTIKAILDYEQTEEMAGGIGPLIVIEVANNATYGISTAEINTGKDLIAVPVRRGESTQDRRIVNIRSQDDVMVVYEIN